MLSPRFFILGGMSASFLSSVVQSIKEQRPNWENLCIVLPNRRARLFLQKELTDALTGPLILPEMVSIDDFVSSISTLIPAPELVQQRALYQSYCATAKTNTPDSFETFLGWSSVLLKDLNTMDQYLLDRSTFFSYLTSLHRLRSWGKDPDTIVQNYTAFWQQLPEMYNDFAQRLEQSGQATPGMCYRAATSLLENFLQHKTLTRFVFCGFNALSPSEEQIIQELLAQDRAQIYWDIDSKMFESDFHQAGRFIRDYAATWPYYKEQVFGHAHALFDQPKKIQVIEVQQQLGQAKQLGSILDTLDEPEDWSKTAVVLADESLLLPLLYALPKSIKQLNITMGFPLEQHPLAVFVSTFLTMALRQTPKGFYYTDVETLLSLPETQALFSSHDAAFCATVLNNAKKAHTTYISASFIQEYTAPAFQNLTTKLFDQDRTPEQWMDDVLELIPMFYAIQQTQPLTQVYTVAAEKFITLFHQIKSVLTELAIEVTYPLLRNLYTQLSAGQKLHFVGAPLEGLQILGMLETRTIDFDRVLMAGVNEGILPGTSGQPSWIPYDVKKEYGLPTQEEQDAIFTYHFYRLMYRAKEVFLLFNGTTDGIQVGEPSRFIRQWAFERPPTHQWEEYIQEATFIPPTTPIKQVPKTTAVFQKLQERAQFGFSPSALNLFVKDGYGFYMRYLLGLKEEDELETTFSYKTYGTIIHNCLEELYGAYLGKQLTPANCNQMIAVVDDVVESQVRAIYAQKISGKNVLALAAIKRTIQNSILTEKEQLEKGNTIELLALEKALTMTCTIPGLEIPIGIRGTIDRVDRYNGAIRVLDYKTGKVDKGKLGIYDWSELVTNPDYGQARQVLIYALLWNDAYPDLKATQAGIISLKAHKEGALYVGEKASENARKKETELTTVQLEKAEMVLAQLLTNLFDAKQPFCNNPDS